MRRPDFQTKQILRAPLERTYSLPQVRELLGVGRTRLHELLKIGQAQKGLHPTRGGLWPTYKISWKSRRVPEGAIHRYLEHMQRLESDPMFAAAMHAQARTMGDPMVRRREAVA